jgi:hypothetical protein
MTPVDYHSCKRIPRSLHALAIVVLLGGSCDIAATAGSRVLKLHLPFGWAVYFTPLLAVAAYAAVGLPLSRTRLGRAAWAVGYVVGALLVCTPSFVEARYAQPILLARWLEPEERAALSARFPYPYIEYSASSQGIRLLIRRSDYDSSLVQFLKSIHALRDP